MALDAAKAAKGTGKATIAVDALQMIAAIYHAENQLQDLSCEARVILFFKPCASSFVIFHYCFGQLLLPSATGKSPLYT